MNNLGMLEDYSWVGNDINNARPIEALKPVMHPDLRWHHHDRIHRTDDCPRGKILVNMVLATDARKIELSGGAFANNAHPLANTGQMQDYGSLSTSGLSNQGDLDLQGGLSTINGSVTNVVIGRIDITHTPAA